MSFLNVMIPTRTVDGLKSDIRVQFEVGLLETTESFYKSQATPVLTQLIYSLERRLCARFEKCALMVVDSHKLYHIDESKGETCVICIKKYESGPAMWTDSVRECALEYDTVLLCEGGYMYAHGLKRGGVYLILWSTVDEPSRNRGGSQPATHRQIQPPKPLFHESGADELSVDDEEVKSESGNGGAETSATGGLPKVNRKGKGVIKAVPEASTSQIDGSTHVKDQNKKRKLDCENS